MIVSLSIKTNKSEKKRRIHFKSEVGEVPAGIASAAHPLLRSPAYVSDGIKSDH